MRRLILFITFLESFSVILLERGLYFLTDEKLNFSKLENLALAACFGVVYVIGAMTSHRLAKARGERPTLRAVVMGLVLLHLTLAMHVSHVTVWLGFLAIGLLTGFKWPIVESYVTAGLSPKQTLTAISRFNVVWAGSVPLALLVTGPLIAYSTTLLMLLAAVIHGFTLLLLLPRLPLRPTHMEVDHPDRPVTDTLTRYRKLTTSSRWAMLGSYTMLFLLAPMMPAIFSKLGFGVRSATGLSAVLDVARVIMFAMLGFWTAWHGRALPLVVSIVVLPISALMVMIGDTTAVVIAGQLVFGFASGLVYHAALYHAMVVSNASVEAGGEHEGLIGLGFVLGPLAGLIGVALGRAVENPETALLAVVLPVLLLVSCLAIYPLLSLNRQDKTMDADKAEKLLLQ